MIFFERHISQVIQRQQKKKNAIIITGPRQVGKTTILKKLLNTVSYITLDDPVLRLNANENASAFLSENKPPLVIDEIQKAPSLFDYVKMRVDEQDKVGQYYFTGSHSFDLMKGVTESLAGRAGIIKMLGLSKRELNKQSHMEAFIPTSEHIEAMKKQSTKFSYSDTVTIIHKGSFPELYKTVSDLKDWRDYYASYLQSYLEKDVKDLIDAKNSNAFIKFIQGAAALSGEQLNIATLAEICGKSLNTVKSWLSILELSGHIYLLQPYSNNLTKRLAKTPKLYFLDTGMICYLGGWNTPQQLTNGARWGHIFESYVMSEILKSYYNDGIIKPKLYYYRDKEKREIDLLVEEGGILYPIEVKTTTNPNESMISNFSTIEKTIKKDFGEGALVCMYDKTLGFGNKCAVINVDMI